MTSARIFYLGYLTLLPKLDEVGADGQVAAAEVLQQAKNAGLITVADTVSGNHPRFREIVAAAAPHIDYLLLNELEAGWLVDRSLAYSSSNIHELRTAAEDVLSLGVSQAVVVHCKHGAALADRAGCHEQGAVCLPDNLIRGSVGAGDAFAAGYMLGIHEGQTSEQCLYQAVCCAAACLTDPTPSAGVLPLQQCLDLAGQYGCLSFQ